MMDELKKTKFNLLLNGCFKINEIETCMNHKLFELPPNIAEKRESIVAEKKTEAERKNMEFYNDTLIRLDKYVTDKKHIVFFMRPTTWFDYVASNRMLDENSSENKTLRQRISGYAKDVLANPITVTVAIISSDSKLLLCRRSRKLYQYPCMLSASSSGFMNANDKLNNVPHPFVTASREIEEELRLKIDPSSFVLTGMGRPYDYMHFQMLLKTEVPMAMNELLNSIKPSEEIEKVITIDNNMQSIRAFLAKNSVDAWVPAGLAAILLAAD